MIPEEAGTRTNQDDYIAYRKSTAGPSTPSRNPCDFLVATLAPLRKFAGSVNPCD